MNWILDHTYIGLKSADGNLDGLALFTLLILIAVIIFVWIRLRKQRREKSDLENRLSSADAAKIPIDSAVEL